MTLSHYMYDSPRPLRFRSMRDDAPAAATGGGSPAPTSTPGGTTASPAAAPSSAASQPAPPPAATLPGSTPAPDPDGIEDGNWKRLRERHDFHKNRAAVLDSLEGITEAELPAVTKNWAAITSKTSTLAKELGYTDEDFKTAFAQDPFETLRILQAEKAEKAAAPVTPAAPPQARQPGESQADFEKRLDALVEARTKPFTEHINKQISDQTIAKIGTELTSAIATALPDAPKEIRDIVNDYVEEYLAGQPAILSTMKSKGDFSAVKEATDFVAGRLKSAFAAWVKSEQERATSGASGRRTAAASPTAPVRPTGSRPTIDEMIEDPSLIGAAYK